MNKSPFFFTLGLIFIALPFSAAARLDSLQDDVHTIAKDVQVMADEINSQIDSIKTRTTENYNKLNDKIERTYNKLNDKIDATLDKITAKLDKSIQDNHANGLEIIHATNDNFYYLLYSLIGMFSAAAGWAILFIFNKLPKPRA